MSLLAIENLSVEIGPRSNPVKIVDRISLSIDKGETLGLVGESGCGKTITAMSSIGLLPSTTPCSVSGSVKFCGAELINASDHELRQLWGNRIGVVFQNPMTSLNPSLTIGFQLTEVLRLHQSLQPDEMLQTVLRMLGRVGISQPQQRLIQYPHELSGGQKQRVCIARALALEPDLLVLDEPTSALDVSVQAQILEVLEALRKRRGLAYLFISHNLAVVRQSCDRVAVMYLGRIVEEGTAAEVLGQPRHPYTRALLASVPRLDARGAAPAAPGEPPNPAAPPPGCAFHPRCPLAIDACREALPPMTDLGDGHLVRCPRIGFS